MFDGDLNFGGSDELDLDFEFVELDKIEEGMIDIADMTPLEIEGEYWQVSCRTLSPFVEAVRHMRNISRDILSQSVRIEVVGSHLVLSATDTDVYIRAGIPLHNTVNILRDTLVIPVDVLWRFIRSGMAYLYVVKREGSYFAVVHSGDIALRVSDIKSEIFDAPMTDVRESSLQVSDFAVVLDHFYPIIASAERAEERRIYFMGSECYAHNHNTVIRGCGNYPSMDIRARDVNIIRSLLRYGDRELSVFANEDGTRKELRGEFFSFSFFPASLSIHEIFRKDLERIIATPGVSVNARFLRSLMSLTVGLENAQGVVAVSNDAVGLSVQVTDRDGLKGRPIVFSGQLESGIDLSRSVRISAAHLGGVLRCIGSDVVTLRLHAEGVGVSSPSFSAILYTGQ